MPRNRTKRRWGISVVTAVTVTYNRGMVPPRRRLPRANRVPRKEPQTPMENVLKKKLSQIKARAQRIQALYLRGRRGAGPLPARRRVVSPSSENGPEIPLPGLFDTKDAPNLPLDDVAAGIECRVESEAFYRVRREGEMVGSGASEAAHRFVEAAREKNWHAALHPQCDGGSKIPVVDGSQLCFFDIETTGLTPMTYLFLGGIMFLEGERFVVEQAFARDYAEERGVLMYVREMLKRFRMVVTYNGDAFDLPFFRTRMAVARIPLDVDPTVVDLLGPARRVFSRALPNCKLGTIERHLRGIEREGDVPGKDIPDVYHAYVRTGNARWIGNILNHNRMDLVAMAVLFAHLAQRSKS